MAVVAGEQLVSAVAGQRDGDLLARDPADQIGGDLGDIGEGLVPDVREPGDDLDRLGVADVDGRVVRPEVGGDRSRLGRLVEGAVGETDGEGAHRTPSECRCIRATIVLESIPPERNAPTGTSATIRAATASDNASSSWSIISVSVTVKGSRGPVPPRRRVTSSSVVSGSTPGAGDSGNVTTWPGSSLRTPRQMVCGAGTQLARR